MEIFSSAQNLQNITKLIITMIIPINLCSADINSDIFICAKLREIKYNYVATFSPKPTIVIAKASL